MITSLLLSVSLLGAPRDLGFTPTPPMRIQQVYEEMERNRAPRITPGTLPYPHPPLPSQPVPFYYYQPPYYQPYHYYWWR